MKLNTLPLLGYDFLKDQFIKLNLDEHKIRLKDKIKGRKKQNKMNQHRPDQMDDYLFKVTV